MDAQNKFDAGYQIEAVYDTSLTMIKNLRDNETTTDFQSV